MAMKPHLHALTLASAKHLLNSGHITGKQHAGIVKKVRMKKPPKTQEEDYGSLDGGALGGDSLMGMMGLGPQAVLPED